MKPPNISATFFAKKEKVSGLLRPWRKALVSGQPASTGFINDRIYEEQMPFIIYQKITIYSIENIMIPISIVFAMILRMKAKTNKLIVYYLFDHIGQVTNRPHSLNHDRRNHQKDCGHHTSSLALEPIS